MHNFCLQRNDSLSAHNPRPTPPQNQQQPPPRVHLLPIDVSDLNVDLLNRTVVHQPPANRQKNHHLLDLWHYYAGVCYVYLPGGFWRVSASAGVDRHQSCKFHQPNCTLYSTQAFNLYSNELYEPLIRGKAQMAINMLARLTMIFLGGAGLVTLQFLNGRGVFVLFGAISLAATVAMYTMPYCTSNPKA